MKKQVLDQKPLEAVEYQDFSDLLFLAWRQEFVFSKCDGSFTHKRDVILEEIAKIEEALRAIKISDMDDAESEIFDQLHDQQTKLINLLYAPYYGGDVDADEYGDLVYSMYRVADGLGWDSALNEIYTRFPNRLEKQVESRGRHWKRAFYFLIVKDYSEPFFHWLLSEYNGQERETPAQFLGFQSLTFATKDASRIAMNMTVTPPSDELIFQTFVEVFDNPSHRHNSLFRAVNEQTDLRLLGSLKALERSLAKGRQRK